MYNFNKEYFYYMQIYFYRIIERNGGKAPLTYHQFQALIASMPPPPPAEAPISAQSLNGATTPVTDDHDDRFGVPTLEELGKLRQIDFMHRYEL